VVFGSLHFSNRQSWAAAGCLDVDDVVRVVKEAQPYMSWSRVLPDVTCFQQGLEVEAEGSDRSQLVAWRFLPTQDHVERFFGDWDCAVVVSIATVVPVPTPGGKRTASERIREKRTSFIVPAYSRIPLQVAAEKDQSEKTQLFDFNSSPAFRSRRSSSITRRASSCPARWTTNNISGWRILDDGLTGPKRLDKTSPGRRLSPALR